MRTAGAPQAAGDTAAPPVEPPTDDVHVCFQHGEIPFSTHILKRGRKLFSHKF